MKIHVRIIGKSNNNYDNNSNQNPFTAVHKIPSFSAENNFETP